MALPPEVCARALGARDARFDGLFYVGITTTRIYCRPVCPARTSDPARRRFFFTPASAEQAGFRPCLRCRPELAPGRALIDAVPRLARAAAHRIEAGALNGRGVHDLARDLGVSERHLRRVLEREIGVSPSELAQTHRLLLAKRLLADTHLSVTRIAFASGFQSLRRFNHTFRERYRMSPSALRRARRPAPADDIRNHASAASAPSDLVRLTLAYRLPLAWNALLAVLQRAVLPGVEIVARGSYRRTVRIDGCCGVVIVRDGAPDAHAGRAKTHLDVDVSPSLLRALMPLLASIRRLFDLDAEPAAVDAHLAQAGLAAHVQAVPGLRVPGALDGFEIALRLLLGRSASLVRRVVAALGEPYESGDPELVRLAPTPECVAAQGASGLATLGVPERRARMLAATAQAVFSGALRLEPGNDVEETKRTLTRTCGLSDRLATYVVMRALAWPDALGLSDARLQRGLGVSGAAALHRVAERWRPWRSYAAMHIDLQASSGSLV
jgi:AraC family transcriptional regulator of adaptative response / DNA-3-methyladenine glycosylase II